jgi:Fe-S-cluster-containing hydrogenase component 2
MCSLNKEGKIRPSLARIQVMSREMSSNAFSGTFQTINVCSQCKVPLCMDVCGKGAIKRDAKTNAIVIDKSLCNNCGKCAITCPLRAIKSTPKADSVLVCDLCGGDPVCAKYCPTQALKYLRPSEALLEKYDHILKTLRSFPESIEESYS